MRSFSLFVFEVGALILSIANIASSVSTGRAEKSYCIDLTSGRVAALRPDTDNVRWMKRPVYNTGACRLQGVIKVTPPTWSRFVHFHMVFYKPYRYSFNLGDSWKNVAKGGDIYGTLNDAEIWGYYSKLKAYRNNHQGTTKIFSKHGVVKTALVFMLGARSMYIRNYAGFGYGWKHDAGLFTYANHDNVYLGINRVIHNFEGYPYNNRWGRGLCTVCIHFSNFNQYV